MTLTVAIADEEEMTALGADLARILRPGDRVGLVGPLGAGKTSLARAILRALADDPTMDVPSPTFTLVQEYALALEVRHVDLYRLADPAEAVELGLGEGEAVELVEWPVEPLPTTVAIAFASGTARTVTVEGPPAFLDALERRRALRRFLADAGFGAAPRRMLAGDASKRRYERLGGVRRAIVMDAPVYRLAPDEYAARVRLADGNPDAFLSVGALLRERGLSAPAVLAADTQRGFLVLEDFGDETIAPGATPVEERYGLAMDALAAFHAAPPPASLPGPSTYAPPRFDAELSAVEVALFPEWYTRTPPDAAFAALWRETIEALPREDDHLALRDVHSPNLLWLPSREGIAKIGFIDYQDAMIAPAAYDVVSLAQDARVDVPAALEARLLARYLAARPGVDEARFRRAYHVLGAQRATRILGVFRRLNDRDGLARYLPHLPRMRRILARNLAAEPSLAGLRSWFAAHSDVMAAA